MADHIVTDPAPTTDAQRIAAIDAANAAKAQAVQVDAGGRVSAIPTARTPRPEAPAATEPEAPAGA